jgi:hypothetical protein
MIPEADNKIAIKHADILPNITRLPGVSLSIGAQTVKGKRKTTRKKSREQLHRTADGTNQFLESTSALLIAIMPP